MLCSRTRIAEADAMILMGRRTDPDADLLRP